MRQTVSRGLYFLAAYTAVNVVEFAGYEWSNFLAAYTAVNGNGVADRVSLSFLAAYTAVN